MCQNWLSSPQVQRPQLKQIRAKYHLYINSIYKWSLHIKQQVFQISQSIFTLCKPHMWAYKVLLIKTVLFILHLTSVPEDFDPCSSWGSNFRVWHKNSDTKKTKSILEDHCGRGKRENKITIKFKGILFPKLSDFKIFMHFVDGADVPILPFGVSGRWGKASAWHIFIRSPKKKHQICFPTTIRLQATLYHFKSVTNSLVQRVSITFFLAYARGLRVYIKLIRRGRKFVIDIIIHQCLCDFFHYILTSSSREAKVKLLIY